MSDCKGCTERHVGCHSSCPKYKELKEKVAITNRNRQKALAALPSLSEEHRRVMYNRMKGKK